MCLGFNKVRRFSLDASTRPAVVGPDPHSSTPFEQSGLQWVDDFTHEIESSGSNGSRLHAFTYHM
jgi:hypothetical protein